MAPGTPSIAGSALTSGTLTAAPGTWASGTSLRYQWFADGVAVSGATARTLVLALGLGGKAMTVRVTGVRAGWATVTRASPATLRVMRWSTPTISGTAAYGSVLTANPGVWTTGTTLRYEWYANGGAISGATACGLRLGAGQRDRAISVKVTGLKAAHTTVARSSALTARVLTAATPVVSGTARDGSTLAVRLGTWTSSTAFAYAWYADGVALSGARYPTLKLGSTTVGKQISVQVTGRRAGYATVTRPSPGTARVAVVGTPVVGGSALVTYTLSARPGTWTFGTTFRYQWLSNGAAITGATGSSLRLSTAHYAKRIAVRVVGSKLGYVTFVQTSGATSGVGYPSRTEPISLNSCPSWAPIKGNADSGIYHVPGGAYYSRTNPEECFRTEAAAVAAGYRKSQR